MTHYIVSRPETPPNTPQRVRIAAQQLERNQRIMDSPQNRRSPNPQGIQVPPLQFGISQWPAGPTFSNHHNDPFGGRAMVPPPPIFPPAAPMFPPAAPMVLHGPALVPPAPALVPPTPALVPPAPALVPPAPALVPPAPALVLPAPALVLPAPALIPPAPALVPPAPALVPPAPVVFGGQVYNHLPANLAAHMAALQAPPAPLRRARGNRQRRQASPPPLQRIQPPPLPPPPPPPPAPQFVAPAPPPPNPLILPKARQPFDPLWPRHYLGKMDIQCVNCNALHWIDERLVNSSRREPKFGMCCTSGKILLDKLDEPPAEIKQLLYGQDAISKSFREHIRNYNNALAMTSLGCKVDDKINRGGAGPYVFKVHGKLTHKAGSLLPAEGEQPKYAQLYIYDGAEALNYRMGHAANQGLDRRVMQVLQDTLYRHHPGVAMYKQAYELTRNMPAENQCKIALRFDERTDRRRYNLPTAAAANEIAVILPGDGDQPQDSRDIILYRRAGQHLERISELHPMYLSLHYVLLFPTGQLGWHRRMLRADAQADGEGGNLNDEENPLNEETPTRKRKYVTQMEWFGYRLFPRIHETQHLFKAGKLLQEFIVDAWALTEQSRLNWVKFNQAKLRVESRQGLMDAIAADPSGESADIGQRIILPSTFSGSTRYMIQNCQDALAINRYFNGPDLFLTATANPNWQEIKEALGPGETASDRPDIVVRVFRLKMKQLLNDIYKDGIMGRTVARVWTIEFQKRGLPHMHMIIFLHPDNKLRTPEDVDSLLSAEFPDEETQPELFNLVKSLMVHTPCGNEHNNPDSPCIIDGKCSKGFPKQFRDQTTVNTDSYSNLRRRDTGKKFKVGRGASEHEVDNRWVVPYCAYLLWRYHCHINVECVASIKAIKYIYKYVYKGHDHTTMQFGTCQDEVQLYLDARYISACEAAWRLFSFTMHEESPAVMRLKVHLEGEDLISWNEDQAPDVQAVMDRAATRDTTLTAYFKANAKYPEAHNLLYQDFPSKFVWKVKTREWTPRQRQFAIGRMYYASPSSGERFYLRTLLTNVKGATSFEDLRTFRGGPQAHVCATFREACILRGLLEDDNEWRQCLQEAGDMASGRQLRNLFVIILRDCGPSDPLTLWMAFRDKICDDLRYALHNGNIRQDPTQDQVFDYGLYLIDRILQNSNKSLRDWPTLPQPIEDWTAAIGNPLIAEQRQYDIEEQARLAAERIPQLNEAQRTAFDDIIKAVNDKSGQTFFLHGPGGTGKTYVYNTLCYYLRGQGKIVVCVASSGIAALLLIGGRTAHSSFKIPLKIHEDSTCAISKNSDVAELLRATDLIIWDEAPMQHRHIHECVNRTFQDIRNNELLFGGISVVFGGDFKQILPVIVKGARAQIVGASLQRSHLWHSIRVLQLTQNMRLNTLNEVERAFAQWQLDVGHGLFTNETNEITLPDHFQCPENTLSSLIHTIYPGINPNALLPQDQYFADRTILCSRNDDVHDLNKTVLRSFPGEEKMFYSADTLPNNEGNGDQGALMYPVEYLNNISCSGLPLHKLTLKQGCPVMVLRNIDPAQGVCNGSRGVVTRMQSRVIEIRLLTGEFKGRNVFIPRMGLIPQDTQIPFEFCRRQFPIHLCFAMTINKAQGQSVGHVGLNLQNGVFTHGQLYVAISRVTSSQNIKAIWDAKFPNPITKNIVYPEVLID